MSKEFTKSYAINKIAKLTKKIEKLRRDNGYIIFTDGYDKDGNKIHKQIYKTYKQGFQELLKKNKELKNKLAERQDE